jgi:hypothetical protein
MQLYILGKNSDDKGTQLEQLTVKILEHQGLEDITTNIQGAGGNEIDITAYSQTTIGICPQKTKVIGECKAHKAPINITDWLKFIGKVHYAREIESNVVGIMVCLSGANGAVVVMYNEKHHNDNTIQLIANRDLINLISNCFDIETEVKVRERLVAMSYGEIYEMNLLYYDRKIYWVTSFMDGKYTVSNAKGLPMKKEELNDIFSLIANYSPYSQDSFIDIREHQETKQHLTTINMVLLTILVNGFSGTLNETARQIKKNDDTFDPNILEMAITQNPFVVYNKEEDIVILQNEESIDIVDFYRYILHSGCPLDLVTSNFYQNHINQELLYKIQKIQYGIEIPQEKIDDCIFFLKHSPSALLRAITPNGLFHGYEAVKSVENMKALYISYFTKMLTDGFVENVKSQSLSDMYCNFFKINQMHISSNIEIEIDGDKRTFESRAKFGLAKLQGCNQSVVCVMAD